MIKIVVSGGAGVIGSHAIDLLISNDPEVVAWKRADGNVEYFTVLEKII